MSENMKQINIEKLIDRVLIVIVPLSADQAELFRETSDLLGLKLTEKIEALILGRLDDIEKKILEQVH